MVNALEWRLPNPNPAEVGPVEGLQIMYDSRGPYLWLVLLILLLFVGAWVALLQLRLGSLVAHYRLLTRGVAAGNLEELVGRHLQRVDETAAKLEEIGAYCRDLDAGLKRSLQRVGVVRFSPFNDVGGDQSFSVALLDAKGDGLVISSLFSRRDSRVYVKPIEKGQSKYALSAEEQQAIQLAAEQGANQRVR